MDRTDLQWRFCKIETMPRSIWLLFLISVLFFTQFLSKWAGGGLPVSVYSPSKALQHTASHYITLEQTATYIPPNLSLQKHTEMQIASEPLPNANRLLCVYCLIRIMDTHLNYGHLCVYSWLYCFIWITNTHFIGSSNHGHSTLCFHLNSGQTLIWMINTCFIQIMDAYSIFFICDEAFSPMEVRSCSLCNRLRKQRALGLHHYEKKW